METKLAVIGCGGLGQLAIKYAKGHGLKVYALDIDNKTLATAKESGAGYTFNTRTDKGFNDKLLEITGGGVDAATVFAAVKAGYDNAPPTLKVGGKLVAVGIPKDDINVSAFDLTMRKYYVVAANNAASPDWLRECAEFTAKHGIFSPSKFFKFDQINEMIDKMHDGTMGGSRMVVKFDQEPERARL